MPSGSLAAATMVQCRHRAAEPNSLLLLLLLLLLLVLLLDALAAAMRAA